MSELFRFAGSQWADCNENTHADLPLWIQQHVEGASSLLQPHLSPLHTAERNHHDLHWPSRQHSLHTHNMKELNIYYINWLQAILSIWNVILQEQFTPDGENISDLVVSSFMLLESSAGG